MPPLLLRPSRHACLLSSSSTTAATTAITTTASPPHHSGSEHFRRRFHSSPHRLATHYDTLALPPSADASSIKKQFYKLSKQYHPDLQHGPGSDPEAAGDKFVSISEAYSTLGDPKKREKYDRDIIRTGEMPQHAASAGRHTASGFGGGGGGPAGGRSPSGLSRRRGQFTGPPPSFYRSGGWGGSGEKRKEHQYKDPFAQGGSAAQGNGQQYQQGGAHEGEESPYLDPNDVPHFDRATHYKSNISVEEQLRRGRRKRVLGKGDGGGKAGLGSIISGGDAGDGMKNFLGMGSVLGLAMALPFLFFGPWRS